MGNKTEDPALVLIAMEYIRHDIMFSELVKEVGPEKTEALWKTILIYFMLSLENGSNKLNRIFFHFLIVVSVLASSYSEIRRE